MYFLDAEVFAAASWVADKTEPALSSILLIWLAPSDFCSPQFDSVKFSITWVCASFGRRTQIHVEPK